MPEIEITEDQREYLEALQEDIQQDVVGKYAHVRMVDAVQYLIDNHEGEINATVTTPSSGPDVSAENAPAADPVAPTEDGGDEKAVDESGADDDETDDSGDADADDAESDGDDAEADDTDEAEDDAEADDSEDEADAGGATSTPPMAAAGGGDDDGMLSAMMALMDTHDDKWEEASGDTGYEVELPDGSTESANTQDDVRAILFKHYE